MPDAFVVDTHALVWFLEANPRLGPAARAVLEKLDAVLLLPIIVIAEACWMIEHGRTSIPSINDFLVAIDNDQRLHAIPLDRSLIEIAAHLSPELEMHDRFIVATALAAQEKPISLLTADQTIAKADIVPTIW